MQNSSLSQKHFDAIAKRYDEFAFLQRLTASELHERLELLNLDVKVLLELGVGTGWSLQLLRKIFPRAEQKLLDSSSEMLEIAKQQRSWKQKLFSSTSMHHALASDTQLSDECIDLVISNLLLPYVKNVDDVFHEMQRVTRADGVFCFTSFGPDTLKELQQVLSKLKRNDIAIQFGQLIDMHIIGDSLLKAGFREPVMDVENMTLTFSDFDSLWNELYFSGLIFGECNQEAKASIASEYEAYRNEEGDLPVSFEVVYAQAWANSNQALKEKVEFQRDGVYNFPLERLKRR